MTPNKNSANCFPDHIHSLDAIRGVASIAVVFWHWQHFFFVGNDRSLLIRENQPLYNIFSVLYNYGHLGVTIFFTLSGFIFFWLFLSRLSSREISLAHFGIDRFSRLYPLHITTFFIVSVLQFIFFKLFGNYFVYPHNDAYHAMLNLLLLPAWGFEQGWSFNAPVWSVSVEMLLYIIFAITCMTGRFKYLIFIFVLTIGLDLPGEYTKVATGLRYFILGGFSYIALSYCLRMFGSAPTAFLLTSATVVTWTAVYIAGAGSIPWEIVFPISISALASINAASPSFMRRAKWLGDISYSTYLLHFPLQMVFAIVFFKAGFSREIFNETWMLVLFLAALIGVSVLSFRFLEVPAKARIRFLWKSAQESAAPPSSA